MLGTGFTRQKMIPEKNNAHKRGLYDVVVIGSGPNGLAAAVVLAKKQLSVLVVEGSETIGGGTRTGELTQPGFMHDICSAVHPLGFLSPFFKKLPLAKHGLKWLHPPVSLAHPLDDGPTVVLQRSLKATSDELGRDGKAWRQLLAPFLRKPDLLLQNLLAPLSIPQTPLSLARFGFYGLRSASGLAQRFTEPRTRALFAGCAVHSILPLTRIPSAAIGLLFAITGHLTDWPVSQGGSSAITKALASYFCSLGGEIQTDRPITTLGELPRTQVIIFDTSPKQMIQIAGKELPSTYLKRLLGYRYGPGVFKIDWALSGPIPWNDKTCALASTVHVGGTLEEIAGAEAETWKGQIPNRPVVLVCQQSHFDKTRAPTGKHTGYAYCHVPNGCTEDMTNRVETQIERFAPGFQDLILDRHTLSPSGLESYNPNNVGGDITGGSVNLWQLFSRPVPSLNPYATPNPRIFLCSASTPPGGGVHGMCGFHAAQAVIKRLDGVKV